MNKIKGVSFIDVEILQQKMAQLPNDEILDLLLEKKENDPFHLLSIKELKKIVADAIGSLPSKEKLVISLYYYEEMTLKEIGETLDLTESRICQIHTKAILRLRGKLKQYLRDDL
jgi:RNA polymerase sigma factor for flagellar operon FliA